MAYTTIDDPSAHFQVKLYSGNNTQTSITYDGNSNLQPDWIWAKSRSNSHYHDFRDTSRGLTLRLYSNGNNAEDTKSASYVSFDSNGFTLGDDGGGSPANTVNSSSNNYASWGWRAGGSTPTKTYKVVVVSDSGNKYRFRNSADSATFAQSAVTLDLQEGGTYVFDWSDSTAQGHPIRFSTTSDGTHGGGSEYTTGVVKDDSAYKTTITVASSAPTLYYYCSNHSGMGGQVNTNTLHGQTNFDGSNLSIVQTNSTAGFSIVKRVGTGSAGATYGHGLGSEPDVIINKGRNTNEWYSYFKSISAGTHWISLESTGAKVDDANMWNDTNATSTIFTVGNSGGSNGSSVNYIAYCFSEVKGYSKFGSYKGNGSTDGAFVYTGFKPAWLMIKRTSDSGNDWIIIDTTRFTFNVIDNYLRANTSDAETDQYNIDEDILSNGFKLRGDSGNINASGATYLYMAFAEHPFVSSKGVPVTAR